MAGEGEHQSVSIHFEERPDKRTHPVSGAWGGPTPDGATVVAHVYAEWGMVPSIQQLSVDSDGRLVPDEERLIKRGDASREIQATLVMTPESAVAFGKWLIERGVAAFNIRQKNPPPIQEGGK